MTKTALVIGGGPAGLMAAEQLVQQGLSVTIAEAKPTFGRKFLMAGKSGLNLTMQEPLAKFIRRYYEAQIPLSPMINAFGPAEVQAWAKGLDQDLFTGSSGRVFPKKMKASPLLRNWIRRLSNAGVDLQTNWRLTELEEKTAQFETPVGSIKKNSDVVILALGGASWTRLGSDGAWASHLGPITPFQPANCAFSVNWSEHMAKFFGHPVKNIELSAGTTTSRGEIILSARGIEGGGIYAISRALRKDCGLSIDLKPDWSIERLENTLAKPRGKDSQTNYLRKVLRLEPIKIALLREVAKTLPQDATQLTQLIKSLPIKNLRPRPMDEAISTAGGIPWDRLEADLMLQDRPGVFCAGEMIDWEAPTGGYLITACLATGRWAGQGAARYAEKL